MAMGSPWDHHGRTIGLPRFHELIMGSPRYLTSTEAPWNHHASMGSPWDRLGITLGPPSDHHEISMGSPYLRGSDTGSPWKHHEIAIFPWNHRGSIIESPLNLYASTGTSWDYGCTMLSWNHWDHDESTIKALMGAPYDHHGSTM